MSDEAAAAPIEVLIPPADTGAELSLSEATAAYTAAKAPKKPTAESAEEATAENELPVEGDAEPEEVPGEDEDAEPEVPAIERPKSWSKDEDAEWQSLPRAMQQKIVARELERDSGTTRSQQEAANARKAAEAERTQAEQARQQYETQAKAAFQVLLREQTRDYPDIKTLDDVRNLAASDPFRYLQWQAHQTELAGAKVATDEAEKRAANEKQTERNTRGIRETALLIEKVPEFSDAKKLDAAQKAAAKLFADVGYSAQELNELGNEPLLGDHRLQIIINDALKFRALQAAKVTALAKPVPPVMQRPGTSQPPGSRGSERIQALDSKLNNSGNMKDAVALYLAQQSRRAS